MNTGPSNLCSREQAIDVRPIQLSSEPRTSHAKLPSPIRAPQQPVQPLSPSVFVCFSRKCDHTQARGKEQEQRTGGRDMGKHTEAGYGEPAAILGRRVREVFESPTFIQAFVETQAEAPFLIAFIDAYSIVA